MAQHALEVRRLLQALDALLRLGPGGNSGRSLPCPWRKRAFWSACRIRGGNWRSCPCRRPPPGSAWSPCAGSARPCRARRPAWPGVGGSALWQERHKPSGGPLFLPAAERLHVAADAVGMIDVLDFRRLRRLLALEGQGQLAVFHEVAGLAGLLLLEQHVGVLVVEERDRRQLKLSERGQGVDLDQIRPPRLGRLRRLTGSFSPWASMQKNEAAAHTNRNPAHRSSGLPFTITPVLSLI